MDFAPDKSPELILDPALRLWMNAARAVVE